MKKVMKVVTLSILLVAMICFVTGCGNKDDKKNGKSNFKVEQVSASKLHVEFNNISQGDEESGKLTVKEGDNVTVTYKLESGSAGIRMTFYRPDAKDENDYVYYEYLADEGDSTGGMPAGEFNVVFQVVDEGKSTGTVDVYVE